MEEGGLGERQPWSTADRGECHHYLVLHLQNQDGFLKEGLAFRFPVLSSTNSQVFKKKKVTGAHGSCL
jgi:hypothetical protein